jgi:superfamily II DNA/RNA helicase
MPPEIKKLSEKFLSNPKTVSVAATSSTSVNVEQFLVNTGNFKHKQDLFYKIFQQEDVKNAFVFCNRKRDINDVCKFMKSKGIKAAGLHGDMEQDERTAALNAFKANETQILVCSDVAARGLDVSAVSHVFNWDVPNHAEDYVHRIGRTGRAGALGRAFTFSLPNDFKSVGFIEKLISKKIPIFTIDGVVAETTIIETPTPMTKHKNTEHKYSKPKGAAKHPRRSPHEERHNISSEKNDGSFGNDLPSFLRGK